MLRAQPPSICWMVPFNEKELADMLGGPDNAANRLDVFFNQLNAGFSSDYAYLGNEPCLETPWIYDFLGQPWKTQSTVRRAITELYSPQDKGYPGNDDLGEMSSWYIFGALGMYPGASRFGCSGAGQPVVFQSRASYVQGRFDDHWPRCRDGRALCAKIDSKRSTLESAMGAFLQYFA